MSSSNTDAGIVDIVMPQIGVSVSEGTVVAWHKAIGDTIAYEEPICDISTDKIDTEVPSSAAGTVVELVADIGDTVDVGAVLARVAPEGVVAPSQPPAPTAVVEAADSPATANAGNGDGAPARRMRSGCSPVVSRIAADVGIDLEQVLGTGRNGRVTKKDLLAFAERATAVSKGEPILHGESPYVPEPPTAPATGTAWSPSSTAPDGPPSSVEPRPPAVAEPVPAGAYVPPPAQPLSRMRATIAAHMKHSQATAATCTSWIEVDMTNVEVARRGLGVTGLSFIARAATSVLGEHPALNAWLSEDLQHTLHQDVNLGIAVSLGESGLIVPVIRRAQDLSVTGLAARIRDLGVRGRERRLTADDLQGGTFTISNAGRAGGLMSTPIINQPQVAILGVEGIAKRPVVITAPDGTDSIAIRSILMLGLSWDHRAMDGMAANEFMAVVKQRLEAVSPVPEGR